MKQSLSIRKPTQLRCYGLRKRTRRRGDSSVLSNRNCRVGEGQFSKDLCADIICPQSAPCTWAQELAIFPHAGIIYPPKIPYPHGQNSVSLRIDNPCWTEYG